MLRPQGLMPQAGSDGRRSAGMTPLGTPTETGLHPGARPSSGFENQQQITGNHPYSFLNRAPNTQASSEHCPEQLGIIDMHCAGS